MRLSKTQRSRLDIAVKVAELSTCKQRHGAAVFSGGRLMSVGYNRSHVNNKWLDGHPLPHTTHAEVDALQKLSDDVVKGATIYIARIFKTGEEAMSAPCASCRKYLIRRKVKSIVYTT